MMTDRPSYIVFATGAVEQIDPDGETVSTWTAPGLYDQLVLAGYPLHRDDMKTFDGAIDLIVDGDDVIAHTSGRAPCAHRMGKASKLFLDWHRDYPGEA